MILVTGATGTVGSNVVRQLVEAGHGGAQVRATSRHLDPAALPTGVEGVRGDLLDPAGFDALLAGVDRVFLYPVAETAAEFAAAAARAGVDLIVLLSSAAGEDSGIGQRHRAVERAVERSGVATAVLRPGALAANARLWAPSIRAEGLVRAPYGDAATAPVHEADIAAVATAALTGDDHAGRVHEISGPESLTVRDQVAVIGRAIARELRFIELSDDEARRQLRRYAPDEVVDSLLVLQRSLVGRPAPVHPTVERVTGRPARRFADWVEDNLDDFG